MGNERIISCVVGGEQISNPGARLALGSADKAKGYRLVDGVNMDVGPVCLVCMPVYDAARTQWEVAGEFDGNPATYIGNRLEDPEFVARQLRHHARERIFAILRGFEEVLLKRDVGELRDFLLRGINVKAYGEAKVDSGDIIPGEQHGGLGLRTALACINEESRTFKFIQALFLHLHDLEKKRDEIEVVDAGCGPIPLFGLMAALKSEKVTATCLEINPHSARMARQIIKNLGLSGRVKVVVADAAQYQHNKPIDLLISETMYSALTEEPLAQILANLAPQLAEGGVMVPEWVTIDAGLVDARQVDAIRDEYPDVRFVPRACSVPPVEVLRLTRENLVTRADFKLSADGVPSGKYRLLLSSRLGLHQGSGLVLCGLESNITTPLVIPGDIVVDDVARGVSIAVRYELGGPVDKFWEECVNFTLYS